MSWDILLAEIYKRVVQRSLVDGEGSEVGVVKLRQVEETGPVEGVEGKEGEREDQPGHLLNIAGSQTTQLGRGCLALQVSHTLDPTLENIIIMTSIQYHTNE